MYNINRKRRNHKRGCLVDYVKNTSDLAKFTDVFFIVFYFCLLIITTIAIIKANVMIVTGTRPAKSKFVINNNTCISIIRLTSSFVGGKPHLLILISLHNRLTHCSKKIKRTKCEIIVF